MYAIDGNLRRSIGDVAEVIAQATDPAKYVGFGFNRGDKHINEMFREQIDRQNKPACYLADQLNRWGTAGRSAIGREKAVQVHLTSPGVSVRLIQRTKS